jgi:Mrp family chromosome partitioning ATPase
MTDELTSSFDWVLADIGPIEPAGRTAAMAGCADGVVLVVAANATRRAVALKVKEDIVAAGGRVLGAVLAERTFPIPEVIYRRL